MTPAVLVVMELGSEWPAHIDDLTSVVGLGPDGADVLQRTQAKLSALGRAGQGVRVAVLACNAATDAAAVVHRATLARALLCAVSHGVHGRLILSARDEASPVLRRALLSLAGQLADVLHGTTASVQLWFTEPSRGHVSRLPETWRPSGRSRRSSGRVNGLTVLPSSRPCRS